MQEPRVSLVKPPDKFFVAVLEKDPFIRGMNSMNIIAMLCGALYINEGVQGRSLLWPIRCASSATSGIPAYCVLGSGDLVRGRRQAHIMFQVKISLPSYFLLHSQSALHFTSVNSVASSVELPEVMLSIFDVEN